MKTQYSFLWVALLLLVQMGCKEDKLDFYSAEDSIYFPKNENVGRVEGYASGHYSFGYVSSFVDHYIHKIPVRITGELQNHDRTYLVKTADTSSMQQGRDYEFLNERFFIPANKFSDTIYLKIKRSTELKAKALNIGVELQANENFALALPEQKIGSGNDRIIRTLVGYNFSADDIAGAPRFWDLNQTSQARLTNNYLGNYSSKKFQLLIGYFELDVEPMLDVKYFPTVALFIGWGYGLKGYLNEMAAKGTPVLEEDGTPMTMGTYIN